MVWYGGWASRQIFQVAQIMLTGQAGRARVYSLRYDVPVGKLRRESSMPFLRAYHLLSAHHALDDLRHLRLKIVRINDLNDPFDLWAVAQPNTATRESLRRWKQQMTSQYGLLCFSMSWRNPLLWSHYAGRHYGIAFGFDVRANRLRKISYVRKRPLLKSREQAIRRLLYTKFRDWRYEKEVRVFNKIGESRPHLSSLLRRIQQ